MDTSLLNNWHALVDGRADFDKCQFITLFKEHGQPHKVAVTWRWRLGGAYLHLGEKRRVAQRFEALTEGNVIEP